VLWFGHFLLSLVLRHLNLQVGLEGAVGSVGHGTFGPQFDGEVELLLILNVQSLFGQSLS